VQETWLRLSRSDAAAVDNLRAWLTTVVARVCLDMLRSRKSRREEPMSPHVPEPTADDTHARDAELADNVGTALLVVLETLAPAERLAFVLHDMFAVPFEEIAPIVERTPAAARQLASRARRRVQGVPAPDADLSRKRGIVEAFLKASREGDFEGLPQALLIAGRLDPIADDSIEVFRRWRRAGGDVRCILVPEAVHGFNRMPTALAGKTNRFARQWMRTIIAPVAEEPP